MFYKNQAARLTFPRNRSASDAGMTQGRRAVVLILPRRACLRTQLGVRLPSMISAANSSAE
jgi:hypothetical protein